MGESDRDCAELAMAYQQARAAADDVRVQWDRHLASDRDSARVALAVGDPQRAFEALDAVHDAEHAARRALFECTQLRRTSQALRAEADQLEDEASALVARKTTVGKLSGVRRPSPRARELERENSTLKRLPADADLQKAALNEIAEGNF